MFSNRNYSLNINYTNCILCQKIKKDCVMVDPMKSRNQKPEDCYKLLVEILTKKDRYCTLPFYLSCLLKRDNAASILQENKAIWHKACRLKYGKKSKSPALNNSLGPDIALSGNQNNVIFEGHKICMFCDNSVISTKFHAISKPTTYDKIKKTAQDLQDNDLLAKLGMSLSDIKTTHYHLECITKTVYNPSKITEKQAASSSTDFKKEAYVDLYVYIERMLLDEDQTIFRLADLKDLLTAAMSRRGISTIDQTSVLSRLKIEILKTFPLLQEFRSKDETFLAKESAISSAIAYKWQHTNDKDFIFSESATLVRKDICDLKPRNDSDLIHQEESVSKDLQKLMIMILQGDKNFKNMNSNQAVLSVCQIIQHNTRKRAGSSGIKKRHQVEYETPLTRYVALLVHSLTRRKVIVNKLSRLGLCVNYSRVLQINTNVGNSICNLYTRHKVVCPPHLPKGQFVTTAIDNVDHNLSSTGAKGSFHGTSISINVHPNDDEVLPATDNLTVFANSKYKKMKPLPTEYSIVEPYEIPDLKNITVPTYYNINYQQGDEGFDDALKTQQEWLNNVKLTIDNDNAAPDISWSSFFGHRLKDKPVVVDHTALLPLIHENVNSPSTIRHGMKLAIKHTNFLNDGQNAVFIGDQPIFAIAKEIQWYNPDEFGEDKMTIMFGGLHIEKTFMACIGDWLKGSEWDIAISEAKIFTSGTAQSCLHAFHITNTRLSHQVTAAVLYIMKHTEFIKTGLPEEEFQQWELELEKKNPQFLFWNIALQLELTLLTFVKLIRERNFSLYTPCLKEMVSWFFALNHPNYARWISVHIRDMQNLQKLNPNTWKEFNAGKFVVQKTKKCFSAMAFDQCHEQHNATVKGDSGVIGLTNNVLAVARWTVAGPEITRLIKEFEMHYGLQDDSNNLHHDMTPATQKKFSTHVKNLLAVFESHGNPFMPDADLVSFISKFKFDDESIKSVQKGKSTGLKNYNEFVTSRFVEKTKGVADPIKTVNLKLMREKPIKKTNFASKELKAVKNDRDLFMKLFLQAQHRSVDLDDFFSHENQPFPPSISDNGYILKYVKTSDTIDCLKTFCKKSSFPKDCTALVLEAESAVLFIKPTPRTKSFDDYFNLHLKPYLIREQEKYGKVIVVFCNHSKNRLIDVVIDERKQGRPQRVIEDASLPPNWLAFLRGSENKDSLFTFLGEKIYNLNYQNIKAAVIETDNAEHDCDSLNTTDFTHEDIRYRIFAQLEDLVKSGHKKIIIRSVDSVVVVISISIFHLLDINELWIAYGMPHQFQYIPAHEINLSLGPRQAACLPFFDALTGSGSVSGFNGYGKKSAFKVFMKDQDFIDITSDLLAVKEITEIEALPKQIEKCVSYLYDKQRSYKTVNDTRKYLFTIKHRSLERIPPTKDCLFHHFKRAMYQGILIWGKMLEENKILLPSPTKWGWIHTNESQLEPLWSSTHSKNHHMKHFIKCCCQKACKVGRCSCKKANLNCTLLCKCQGNCYDR